MIKIMKKYNKCIITSTDKDYCKAAHIVPYSECTDEQKYDVNNGLLIDLILHKAFELYKWSIK